MLKDLDENTAATLRRFRFDEEVLARAHAILQTETGAGERISGAVASPDPEDFVSLPAHGSVEGEELDRIGKAALLRGEVGVVVLAGGMATRFGGIVKAVANVVRNCSFLELKLADIESVAASLGGVVPVFLLTSFATRDQIQGMLHDIPPLPHVPVEILEQSVSVRLTGTGEVFRDAAGKISLCATGHGDLLSTLRVSGFGLRAEVPRDEA